MERNDQMKFEKPSKAYEPPKVMRVSLRPEEAVLGPLQSCRFCRPGFVFLPQRGYLPKYRVLGRTR